tara:strand:+ start:768 stop:1274 length:507 start_codon:yes stop_codon:yes gene_type:complete
VSLSLIAILLLSVPDVDGKREVDILSASPVTTGTYVPARPDVFAQVRIEKRVIIRVPRRRPNALTPKADFSQETPRQKYKEKKIGKCLPMDNILGVQMFAEQYLDLLTRDRKRIRARLEDNCPSRSFYSGFYMEKSSDGRICAGRDILHSRTGAKCEIERFRELVPQR